MNEFNLIAVTGANSGLGLHIVHQLKHNHHRNTILSINGPEGYNGYDLTDELGVRRCAEDIDFQTRMLCKDEDIKPDSFYRILINCAGVNYIEWFEQADWHQYERLMNLNLRAGLMLVQELIGVKPPFENERESWFNGSGCVLNIISNASHVPMTNSVFYNASKGAFHIATLAMARELRKTHGLCVFGISPNKLAGTGMSDYIEDRVPGLRGWTPEQAASYQIGALPAGEETDPDRLAEFIAFLLDRPERHKYLTNTVIPYGA